MKIIRVMISGLLFLLSGVLSLQIICSDYDIEREERRQRERKFRLREAEELANELLLDIAKEHAEYWIKEQLEQSMRNASRYKPEEEIEIEKLEQNKKKLQQREEEHQAELNKLQNKLQSVEDLHAKLEELNRKWQVSLEEPDLKQRKIIQEELGQIKQQVGQEIANLFKENEIVDLFKSENENIIDDYQSFDPMRSRFIGAPSRPDMDDEDDDEENDWPGYITDDALIEEYKIFNPEGYKKYKYFGNTLHLPFDEYQKFMEYSKSLPIWFDSFTQNKFE